MQILFIYHMLNRHVFQFHWADARDRAKPWCWDSTWLLYFYTVCYKCNMGVVNRPWYGLSHNNHFAIVAWPGLIPRICFVIGGIERTQYKHLSHLSTKLGRQFGKHEFLIKRSSFSQFLTFSLSKFFSIIHILSVSHPQLNTCHWAHIHSFACLLKRGIGVLFQDCCTVCVPFFWLHLYFWTFTPILSLLL